MFPTRRPRRSRLNRILRTHVQEHHLRKEDFISPIFIVPGKQIKKEIQSMPRIYQFSLDECLRELEELLKLGISMFLLFGIPSYKDETGSSALDQNGIIQRALREAKREFGEEIFLVTDLCFCEYTSHGHCGVLQEKTQTVDNDATNRLLGLQALSHCEAGVDMLAPSGMMDGQIQAIRSMIDSNGFTGVPILSYAVKYASAFYGPFRDAVDSAPQFGDRNTYQMNPANSREAILEALEDLEQGADLLMVKPALAYLDIVRELREKFLLPLVVYNTSGEYAMIRSAGSMGYIDEKKVILESLISMKRAGADLIISYFARDLAVWLSP